jgi:hypothetical protein
MRDASSPSQITLVKFGKSHTNLPHVYQLDTVVYVAADRHCGLRTASRASRVLYMQQKERFADECTCTQLPYYFSR